MGYEQPKDNLIGLLETMRSIKVELYSIKEDNEKLLKASKEQEKLNDIMLKNVTDMKQLRQIGHTSSNAKKELSNEESHKCKDYKTNSDQTKLLNEESSEDNSSSNTLHRIIPKTKKIKWHEEELLGEFKKIIPPNFDGEFEEGEES
jgi:hypothetical protein